MDFPPIRKLLKQRLVGIEIPRECGANQLLNINLKLLSALSKPFSEFLGYCHFHKRLPCSLASLAPSRGAIAAAR